MVPSYEPAVKKGATPLARRVTVKLPCAPANRPVPPVMVWTSSILNRLGSIISPDPAIVVEMLSPLAAIRWADPVEVAGSVAKSTTTVWVNEN